MARSAGFTGDCAMAVRYEELVIAYHHRREQSEPQEAFYEQGETGAGEGLEAGHIVACFKAHPHGVEISSGRMRALEGSIVPRRGGFAPPSLP